MSDTKNTIHNALAITFIATLFFFALTFVLLDFFNFETSLKEAWETLGSFFGGITTLVAAYIASKLFNDWRDEKNHETKTIYLDNVIKSLTEIHLSLINCRSNAFNLKTINENTILISRYIEEFSSKNSNNIVSIYSNLYVVHKISNNDSLLDIYYKFDKHIYVFDSFNSILLEKYKRYFDYQIKEYYPSQSENSVNIFTRSESYDKESEKNAIEINKFIEGTLIRLMGGDKERTNYLAHIEDCLNIYEIFIEACIKSLKANK